MNIVDKYTLKFWNNTYYCLVRFPDGSSQELKSDKDLTYTGWQELITKTWEEKDKPPEPTKEWVCPGCGKSFVC